MPTLNLPMKITVVYDGGKRFELDAVGPRLLVAWERRYDTNIMDLQASPRTEWWCFFAWEALREQYQPQPGVAVALPPVLEDFERFLASVELLEVDLGKEEPEGKGEAEVSAG